MLNRHKRRQALEIRRLQQRQTVCTDWRQCAQRCFFVHFRINTSGSASLLHSTCIDAGNDADIWLHEPLPGPKQTELPLKDVTIQDTFFSWNSRLLDLTEPVCNGWLVVFCA